MIYNNVLVHSFYRCGTNRFMQTLEIGYKNVNMSPNINGELFSENFLNNSKKPSSAVSMEEFESLARSDKPFIVKLMDHDLAKLSEYEYKVFLTILYRYKFYVIRMERENIKELVYSNYIASATKQWFSQSDESIIANYEHFSKIFKYVMKTYVGHFLAKTRPIPYNQKITFEEFFKNPNKIKIEDVEYIFDGDDPLKPSIPKERKILNYEEMESWYNELYCNYMKEK